MDDKDRDLEAGVASSRETRQERGTVPRALSPSGSTSTDDDDDKITARGYNIRQSIGDQATEQYKEAETLERVSTDDDSDVEGNHGEPDADYRDAESTALGRDLDRQLSRVSLPTIERDPVRL